MEERQSELWVGLVELMPVDPLAQEWAGAFTNVVCWAESAELFRSVANELAASISMCVVSVDEVEPLRSRGELTEEMADLRARAERDRGAQYGTSHTYPFDAA